MRNDLIRRMSIIPAIKEYYSPIDPLQPMTLTLEQVSEVAENLPTIEAAPVVHGKWICSENDCGETDCICSNCKSEAPSEFGRYTYIKSEFCHCCGTKMDME